MTQPGALIPPQPGWWVRTDHIGTANPGYGWAVSAVGAKSPQGSASSGYGWAGSATGVKPAPPVVFKGINVNNGNSVTISSHNVGDIIVIFGYDANVTTAVVPPSASGTVPAWATIDNNAGANSCASITAYFVATATNHTSGSWTNASHMFAVVLSGQGATPIGGHAESGGTATGSAVAPAVTLARTDGTSMLLHFFGVNYLGSPAWSAAPGGYTQRSATSPTVCCDTKDSTTSDGALTQTYGFGSSAGYRGATIEIRAY